MSVVPDLTNEVGERANAARDRANTARDRANAARDRANAARDRANTARDRANTAGGRASAVRDRANTARGRANTARDRANVARDRANAVWEITKIGGVAPANAANTLRRDVRPSPAASRHPLPREKVGGGAGRIAGATQKRCSTAPSPSARRRCRCPGLWRAPRSGRWLPSTGAARSLRGRRGGS